MWINTVVYLNRNYDYNYTKSGVEILNSPMIAIYLGLVLLTLIFLKEVAFILQLVVDDGKIKMGGAGTFHCISTMSLHIYFIKIDINDLLLTCISVVQDIKTYVWVFVSNCFWNSENFHDNIGKSWNHITLMTWWDTYIH